MDITTSITAVSRLCFFRDSWLSAGLALLGCLAVLGLSWTLGLRALMVKRAREIQVAQVEAEHEVVVEQERNRIARSPPHNSSRSSGSSRRR